MKILLADDSSDARLLLHWVLRDAGYRDTLSASSAHDAFKYLDLEHADAGAKEIDLIVMDVRMPEIGGMEACRRIKAVEALRDIPIIMMTARSHRRSCGPRSTPAQRITSRNRSRKWSCSRGPKRR
jgi:sigma-B regulation protein RsbU (phosphoserine phosphatase)